MVLMLMAVHRSHLDWQPLGVWFEVAGDLQAYYPPQHAGWQQVGRQWMDFKGSLPTWSEWFEQLADRPPYGIWWDVEEVPDGASPAQCFALAQRHQS
jgi:hypothetical protein